MIDVKEVMVSIVCITYNHEKYIARALESFVTQDTNFTYEILIHDDASTDRTAEIIKKYEKAYPDIIYSVIQKENKYSQNAFIEDTYLIPIAKGKYIAECEGDDFWTDPYKLQKQFDFMEAHPECSLCTHASLKVRASDEKELERFSSSPNSRYFSTEEIIGNDHLFSTNSMFYIKEHVLNVPDFVYTAPVADYSITIWLSLKGDVYYMDEAMSAYRVGVENSWTSNFVNSPETMQDHYNEMEVWLRKLNVYTEYEFTESIKRQIQRNRFRYNKAQYKLKDLKTEDMINLYNELGIIDKAKLNIGYYVPASLKLSKFITQSMNGQFKRQSGQK